MTDEDSLWAMEERFWTEGANSARTMTAKGAVFVFPYPVGILRGDQIWREGLVAQRWRSVGFSVLPERRWHLAADGASANPHLLSFSLAALAAPRRDWEKTSGRRQLHGQMPRHLRAVRMAIPTRQPFFSDVLWPPFHPERDPDLGR
jgi:hypothetical protein